MKLNRSSSYVLLRLIGGDRSSAEIGSHLKDMEMRTIQRALERLAALGFIRRAGPVNNPSYEIRYDQLLMADIPETTLTDENRPETGFNFGLMNWLERTSLDTLSGVLDSLPQHIKAGKLTAKELEYLTVELSWKSSALEGNTYTLLDTQLLFSEGLRAKGHTEFETQMILNHKAAINFVVENQELFQRKITLPTLEQLHRTISKNMGFPLGIRRKLVRVSASNYVPLGNSHSLREQAHATLAIIGRQTDPVLKSLLALSLIPYLQLFEDGNKRTGRLLANAILITTLGRGFSLRKVDARELALAYLAFYEFGSLKRLARILAAEA